MSDEKEKDSKVKSSKAKKNVEKTQEVSVSAEKKIFPHSCTDCGVLNCSKRNASYPEFCLTEKLTEKELEKVVKLYTENEENNKSDDNGLHASACGMRQLSGYTAYR